MSLSPPRLLAVDSRGAWVSPGESSKSWVLEGRSPIALRTLRTVMGETIVNEEKDKHWGRPPAVMLLQICAVCRSFRAVTPLPTFHLCDAVLL